MSISDPHFESAIVWLRDPNALRYVRECCVVASRRRGPVRVPGSIVVAYAELRPSTPSLCYRAWPRRVWTLRSHDFDLDPTGIYHVEHPAEAVLPTSIRPTTHSEQPGPQHRLTWHLAAMARLQPARARELHDRFQAITLTNSLEDASTNQSDRSTSPPPTEPRGAGAGTSPTSSTHYQEREEMNLLDKTRTLLREAARNTVSRYVRLLDGLAGGRTKPPKEQEIVETIQAIGRDVDEVERDVAIVRERAELEARLTHADELETAYREAAAARDRATAIFEKELARITTLRDDATAAADLAGAKWTALDGVRAKIAALDRQLAARLSPDVVAELEDARRVAGQHGNLLATARGDLEAARGTVIAVQNRLRVATGEARQEVEEELNVAKERLASVESWVARLEAEHAAQSQRLELAEAAVAVGGGS